MGGAGVAWVVCSERHLNHVQDSVGDVAVLDQAFCGLLDGHADGCVIVGGSTIRLTA